MSAGLADGADAARAHRAPRAARAEWVPWTAWALAGVAGVLLWKVTGTEGFARAAAAPGGCAVREWTGVGCLTCGLTRAFAALARGEWRASLALHPWALLAVAQAAGAWVAWGAWRAGALRQRPDRWIPRAIALNLLALALLWAARFATGTLPS